MNKRMTSQSLIISMYREDLGLSQVDLAKKLGMTPQFYGRIEKGFVGIPKRKLRRVCKVLGINSVHLKEALVSDYRSELDRNI